MVLKSNPIINSDFPDMDIIRVDDTYYMVSTTMHFMPGCDILRSYDLMNWEFVTHAYDFLEETDGQCLVKDNCIYGKGMWAPCIRYHKGTFYIVFVANDTQKTYLFKASDIAGPWTKQEIEGFYHDCSLLFDDDERVYIVYGNTTIYLTELKSDLSGPKPGGLHRTIAKDEEKVYLGYEGSHLYKYNGKYYLFCIHMKSYGNVIRSEVCFVADSLEGDFICHTVLEDDMGYRHSGVAQGGIVDTPDGEFYAYMFQDRGAVGRSPVMMPMHFEEGIPMLGENGKIPHTISIPSTRPDYVYEPLNGDDDFFYQPDEQGVVKLKPFWQFNHIPVNDKWSVTEKPGTFRIYSNKICNNLIMSNNTLTQRMIGPECSACVTVDGSKLNDGDYAGLCAFQGCYGAIALTKEAGKYFLVMLDKPAKDDSIYGDFTYTEAPVENARIEVASPIVTVKVAADFSNDRDIAKFYYEDKENGSWSQLGIDKKLYFKLDHFTGCRFGMFYYATKKTGGVADFTKFRFQ